MRFPALAAACLALTGCCWLNQDRHFRGDGELRALICWPFENYALDLGAVELAATGAQTFEVAGLPKMAWSVGFAIPRQPSDPLCPEMIGLPWIEAVVEVEVSEVGGATVFQRSDPLADWTWTYAGGPNEAECRIYSRPPVQPAGRETRYRVAYRVLRPAPDGARAPTIRRDLRTFAIYMP